MRQRSISKFIAFAAAALFLIISITFSGCFGEEDGGPERDAVPVFTNYSYNIVNTFPHDPDAFCQGLLYHDGYLYEGTGLNGESGIRKVDLETGDVLQQADLDKEYFGEGITIFGDKLYQLSWKAGKGFVYDLDTFDLLQEWEYDTEGWGLTQDGEGLLMSDGTDHIYFLNPDTLEITHSINVTLNGSKVSNINELEYVQGSIYANIWKEDRILMISPQTGEVTGEIDLIGLLRGDEVTGDENVLNGIAYDETGDRLFVTGKLWPHIYEIDMVQTYPPLPPPDE